MDLASIRALVATDLAMVDSLIDECLHSDITLVQTLGRHLIYSGGKRLRPLVVLLGAHAFHYQEQAHLELAAALELIHTATLLHDDVVDVSELRRGKKTANVLWGNSASVLIGDLLYSRAFQLMIKVNNWRVLQSLANATNTIASGEVLQLVNCYQPELKETVCLQIIQAKTGILFATAAQQGAILTQRAETEIQAMADYGMHLGVAFQLIDDLLDYCPGSEDLGKNRGDDLADGKLTVPLVYALNHSTAQQSKVIRQAIQEGNRDYFDFILEVIESTGAIAYTRQLAQQQVTQALMHLDTIPVSPYRQALVALAEFSSLRYH